MRNRQRAETLKSALREAIAQASTPQRRYEIVTMLKISRVQECGRYEIVMSEGISGIHNVSVSTPYLIRGVGGHLRWRDKALDPRFGGISASHRLEPARPAST